tara:strand:+ start:1570 stop:1848 length:279 start_codon:yes stop_codon:yes gene_type:complete
MAWDYYNINKAEKLNSYDETNAFAYVLVEFGEINSVQGLLDFYEKPYNWQEMYEDLLELIEKRYGEPASITELVDVDELREQAETYFKYRKR